jgi:hypothetical protein
MANGEAMVTNFAAYVLTALAIIICLVFALQATVEKVTAVFTVVLGVATTALVITAIIQHGDALDAIQATNRFAKAAEDYANYTKSLALSSTRTIETNIASERATFQILKFELVEKQPNDPTPTVNYSFINMGRTAAVINEFNIECELIGENMSAEPNYDPKKTKISGGQYLQMGWLT